MSETPVEAEDASSEATMPPRPPRRTMEILIGCAILGVVVCAVGTTVGVIYTGVAGIATLGAKARATQEQMAREEARATQDAQSLQATAEAASTWPAVVLDSFDSNEHLWITGRVEFDSAVLSRRLEDGAYRWEATAKDSFMEIAFLDSDPLSDFYLAVTVQRSGGKGESGAGVVFRVEDEWYGGYYFFYVNSTGQFALWYWDGADWTGLIPESTSHAISTEGPNRLEVSSDGDWIRMLINGEFVGDIADSRQPSGTVGLAIEMYAAGDQVLYEFDDFELRAP